MVVSNFLGVFVFSHLEDVWMSSLHIDLAFEMLSIYLSCDNGVMIKIGHVMDDVLHYHAHTLFAGAGYFWWKFSKLAKSKNFCVDLGVETKVNPWQPLL